MINNKMKKIEKGTLDWQKKKSQGKKFQFLGKKIIEMIPKKIIPPWKNSTSEVW